jgi:hypothetical protein
MILLRDRHAQASRSEVARLIRPGQLEGQDAARLGPLSRNGTGSYAKDSGQVPADELP